MGKDKEKEDYASEDKGECHPFPQPNNDMLPDIFKTPQKSNDSKDSK